MYATKPSACPPQPSPIPCLSILQVRQTSLLVHALSAALAAARAREILWQPQPPGSFGLKQQCSAADLLAVGGGSSTSAAGSSAHRSSSAGAAGSSAHSAHRTGSSASAKGPAGVSSSTGNGVMMGGGASSSTSNGVMRGGVGSSGLGLGRGLLSKGGSQQQQLQRGPAPKQAVGSALRNLTVRRAADGKVRSGECSARLDCCVGCRWEGA